MFSFVGSNSMTCNTCLFLAQMMCKAYTYTSFPFPLLESAILIDVSECVVLCVDVRKATM